MISQRTTRKRMAPNIAVGLAAIALLMVCAPATARFSATGHPTFLSPHASPLALTDSLAFVANTPADTVDVIDIDRRRVIRRIEVGIDPVGMAIRPDGKELWVANHVSDSISIIDLDPERATYLQIVDTIQDFDPLTRATRFDEPVGVAFASDAKAYVALSTENKIAVIDVPSRTIRRRLTITAQDPRAIAVRGERLYVIPFESNNRTQLSGCVGPLDGNLCTFDVFQHAVASNNVLSTGYDADIVKHPSVPDRDLYVFDTTNDRLVDVVDAVGTLLYGIAVDSTGRVFVAQTDARNDANGRAGTMKDGLAEMQNRAFLNQITMVDCRDSTCGAPTFFELEPTPPVDPQPGMALATPYAIAISDDDATLIATAASSNQVYTMDAATGAILGRVAVDAAPRGIALRSTADGAPAEAWVLNAVANTVSIIDASTPADLTLVDTVVLGDPTHPAVKRGRTVFHDARASTNGTFSCESCHPDGNTDQLLWVLDTPRCNSPGCTQIMPRLTMPIRGLRDTAPYHWDGIPGDPYGGNNTANLFGNDAPTCDLAEPESCTRDLVDGGLGSTMCAVGACPTNNEGKLGALSAAERDDMATFLLSTPYPPAQRRSYDNQLTAVAEAGFRLFHIDGDLQGNPQPNVCGDCHRMPFWVTTNTPGTGMDAPTWRGAYDRWMILPQGRINVIDLGFYRSITGLGTPEQQMWGFTWGSRQRFDPVWNMVTEGSTGFSGAFARQVTLNANTAEAPQTLTLLDALEQSAADDGTVLQGEGVLIEEGGVTAISLEFDGQHYRTNDDAFDRGTLLTMAQSGSLVATVTARLGPNVDVDHPQPALWSLGPIHLQRGRQQFPTLDASNRTLRISGRHVATGARIIIDGRRASGNVRCSRGVLPDCANEVIEVQLAALPQTAGMHFLQLQNPDGLFSNDYIFHTQSSGGPVAYDLSGPWFNPDQNGHGWFLEQLDGPGAGPGDDDPQLLNAYWYVYQDAQPVWLVGLGSLVDGRARLNMFITSGGDFPPQFDAQTVSLTPWGSLEFEFADNQTASVRWESNLPEFGSGSQNIMRLGAMAGLPAGCRSGSYYNASQSGHGFVAQVLDVNGQTEVLVSWYVYQDGQQVWLLGQAPLVDDQAQIAMTAFAGARFPPAFASSDVTNTHWGSLALRFLENDQARVDWISELPGYANGGLGLQRLTTLSGRACPD